MERAADIGAIFGEVLRRHRSEKNISQEELAFLAGVDRTFVSRLERGIRHAELEAFKTRVMNTQVHGMTIAEWDQLFRASNKYGAELVKAAAAKEKAEEEGNTVAAARAEAKARTAATKLERADQTVRQVLADRLGITEGDPEQLLE